MKNITVSVDDETYRRARIRAAERDTSVSALVREYLNGIATEESEFERLRREEIELRKQVRNFRPSENIPREQLYDRKLGRGDLR